MTNEELLQQAKDQVAKENNYPSWNALLLGKTIVGGQLKTIDRLCSQAAALAIQRAREEAAPKWIFTSDAIPEPSSEDPDNSYYVLGSKGWSYAPMVVYYSHIAREFMSRETNAPVKGILFWTTLLDQPGINEKGKLTAPGR